MVTTLPVRWLAVDARTTIRTYQVAARLWLSAAVLSLAIGGLLHDMGKLMLDQYVLKDYNVIAYYVHQSRQALWQVEERLIGIDHARVGGLMAKHWNFPVQLVDAIRFHHTPSFAHTHQWLPAMINLANHFSSEFQQSNPDLFSFPLHPETLNILNLDTAQVEVLKNKMKTSVETLTNV